MGPAPAGGAAHHLLDAQSPASGRRSGPTACLSAGRHACPLLLVEDLVADKPWAARRHHAFVAAGMTENRADCAQARQVGYLPVVEVGEASVGAVLADLLPLAVEVVVDAFPCHVAPQLNANLVAQAAAVGVRVSQH